MVLPSLAAGSASCSSYVRSMWLLVHVVSMCGLVSALVLLLMEGGGVFGD